MSNTIRNMKFACATFVAALALALCMPFAAFASDQVKVTAPTEITASVAADGVLGYPTNAYLENASAFGVKVTGVAAVEAEPFALVASGEFEGSDVENKVWTTVNGIELSACLDGYDPQWELGASDGTEKSGDDFLALVMDGKLGNIADDMALDVAGTFAVVTWTFTPVSITGDVSISGTYDGVPYSGMELAASVENAPAGVTLKYVWYVGDTAGERGTLVAENVDKWTPGAEHEGKYVTVVVTDADEGLPGELVASLTEPIAKPNAYALLLDNSANSTTDTTPMVFVKSPEVISAGETYESDTYGAVSVSSVYEVDEEKEDYASVSDVPWYSNPSPATSVTFEDAFAPKNTEYWFCYMDACTSMDLAKLNTSNVTDTNFMFYHCSKLTTLDLSGFDTANVTNMSGMFSGCSALASLDVSKFDTANVTDMGVMFEDCDGLTTAGPGAEYDLNLSGFDTANVTNMRLMFSGCSALTELDVSGFDTGNVTDMSYMFQECTSLAELDVSEFDTGNVTNMSLMFQHCSKLTTLDLSGFDTASVTGMTSMFSGCSALTELDVSEFDTGNVTNMSFMFYHCSKLTTLDLSGFETGNVKGMNSMFSGCLSLITLDVSGFDTASVTGMNQMFEYCSSLTELDLSSFDTSNVTSMAYMFRECSNLVTIYASELWSTTAVTSSDYMFYNCSAPLKGDVTWTGGKATDKTYAKTSGGYLTYKVPGTAYALILDNSANSTTDTTPMIYVVHKRAISAGDTYASDTYGEVPVTAAFEVAYDTAHIKSSGVPWYSERASITSVTFEYELAPKSTAYWFYGMTNCSKINLTKFDGSQATDMRYMFANCSKITSISLPSGSGRTVTTGSMAYMFQGCTKLTKISLPTNFGTGVTSGSMASMFQKCTSLTSLTLPTGFGDSVTSGSMASMFSGCTKLKTLSLPANFGTNVKTGSLASMFQGCSALTTLTLPSGFGDIVTSGAMTNMFSGCTNLKTLNLPTNFGKSVTTSKLTGMFQNCSSLTSLNLSYFKSTQVTSMANAFTGMKKLQTVKFGANWAWTGEDTGYLPDQSANITGADGKWYDTTTLVGYEPASVPNGAGTYVAVNPGISGTVTIDNTAPAIGDTLTASASVPSVITPAYQWHADGVAIDGATAATYVVTVDDFGKSLHVVVTDGAGTYAGKVESSETAAVGQGRLAGTLAVDGAVDGEYLVGETLTASAAGLPAGADVEFIWYVGDTPETATEVVTTGKSLTLTEDMKDRYVKVSATDMTGLYAGTLETTPSQVLKMEAYAVLTLDEAATQAAGADRYAMTFIRSAQVPIAGESTYGDKTVQAVYEVDETKLYSEATHVPWYSYENKANITSVTFVDEIAPISTAYWFYDLSACTSMDLAKLDTTSVTDMSGMFEKCTTLAKLDVTGLETGNTSVMYRMFFDCYELESLDLSNFNTGKVTSFAAMFGHCKSLTKLDVSSFDTANANSFYDMFAYCDELVEIVGLDGFDTGKATIFQGMFHKDGKLKSVDLSSFNTANATTMYGMFTDDAALTEIAFPNTFTTANVANFNYMFDGCTGLAALDLSGFDTSSATSMSYMFDGMTALAEVTLGAGFDFTGAGDAALCTLPEGTWVAASDGALYAAADVPSKTADTYTLSNAYAIYSDADSSLTFVRAPFAPTEGEASDLVDNKVATAVYTGFETTTYGNRDYVPWYGEHGTDIVSVTFKDKVQPVSTAYWFAQLVNCTTFDLEKLDTSKAESLAVMFQGCISATGIDVSGFDTSGVEHFEEMFSMWTPNGTSSKLTAITGLESFDTENGLYFQNMFYGCSMLTELDLSSFDTSSATNVQKMFFGMSSLEKITLSADFAFDGCGTLATDTEAAVLPDGTWQAENDSALYAAADVPSKKADTYLKSDAYAVYDDNAKTFYFVRSASAPVAGQTFAASDGTQIAVANVYSGVESMEIESIDDMPWYNDIATKVESVVVKDTVKPTNMGWWFFGMENCTSVDIAKLDGSEVADLTMTFSNMTAIETLELPTGFGSNAVSLSSTFSDCKALKTLTLPAGFGQNATNLVTTFSYCESLTELELPTGFGQKAEEAYATFNLCKKLESITIPAGFAENAWMMDGLFSKCYALTEISLPEGFGQNAKSIDGMFYRCETLPALTLPAGFGQSATDMGTLFGEMHALTELTLPAGFGAAKPIDMSQMFSNSENIGKLDLSMIDTSAATDMNNMFYNCTALAELNVSGWNTGLVTRMDSMFNKCSSLTELDLSNFDTSSVTDMSWMFFKCTALEKIYASDLWGTDAVTSSTGMFNDCTSLVGDIAFDSSYTDKTYAKTSGGYLTYKAAPAAASVSDYSLRSVSMSDDGTGNEEGSAAGAGSDEGADAGAVAGVGSVAGGSGGAVASTFGMMRSPSVGAAGAGEDLLAVNDIGMDGQQVGVDGGSEEEQTGKEESSGDDVNGAASEVGSGDAGDGAGASSGVSETTAFAGEVSDAPAGNAVKFELVDGSESAEAVYVGVDDETDEVVLYAVLYSGGELVINARGAVDGEQEVIGAWAFTEEGLAAVDSAEDVPWLGVVDTHSVVVEVSEVTIAEDALELVKSVATEHWFASVEAAPDWWLEKFAVEDQGVDQGGVASGAATAVAGSAAAATAAGCLRIRNSRKKTTFEEVFAETAGDDDDVKADRTLWFS